MAIQLRPAGDNTSFGSIDTASGSRKNTFTIDNTAGTATLVISSINVSGDSADFTVGSQPSQVLAGETTTFDVTFDPTVDGLRSATVVINSNDADEAAFDFAITGTGTTPEPNEPEINVQGNGNDIADGDTTPSTSDDTDFGNVDTSSGSTTNSFLVENVGDATLTVSSIVLSGTAAADFSVASSLPGTIAPGAQATIDITFDPSADGVRTATLTIANDDADEATFDFGLQGTGTTPEPTPPQVASVQINDGSSLLPETQTGASKIKSIVVTFDQVVVFAGAIADAFELQNTSTGEAITGFNATADDSGGQTVVTIENFTGVSVDGTSLADGDYSLTTLSALVSAEGFALDGDGDGDPGPDAVDTFFRLFGDEDGDGQTDSEDLGPFNLQATEGSDDFDQRFDFDEDGALTYQDYFQIHART